MTLSFFDDRTRTSLLMLFEFDEKDGSLTVSLREPMHRLTFLREEVAMLRGFLEAAK